MQAAGPQSDLTITGLSRWAASYNATGAGLPRQFVHEHEFGAYMTTTYFNLAGGNFFQDWSNTGLITTDDNWDGVPSIVGYRGDDVTSATGADPRTLTGDGTVVIDVNANQTNPNTFSTGGVAEFAIANPTIALNGSGTGDAPYIVLHLDATGHPTLHLHVDA